MFLLDFYNLFLHATLEKLMAVQTLKKYQYIQMHVKNSKAL